MTDAPRNVLFLCIANSARSIMAEAILSRLSAGRFVAYSAGSKPSGHVDPSVLQLLGKLNHRTDGLHSKSWHGFSGPTAPRMDFVFTVCDESIEESATGQICPTWEGEPLTAHWGVPDPASLPGSDAERAAMVADVYRMLSNRISIFANLPLTSLDRLSLQKRLSAIGGMPRI